MPESRGRKKKSSGRRPAQRSGGRPQRALVQRASAALDPAARAVEEALRRGLEAEAEVLRAGARIREQSKVAYGTTLLDARLTLTAVVADSMALHAGEPAATDVDRSASLALIAAYVQGISVVETLISEAEFLMEARRGAPTTPPAAAPDLQA